MHCKNNDCFQKGFPYTLPLVNLTDSPAPNSHHWLSHCCCAGVGMLKQAVMF